MADSTATKKTQQPETTNYKDTVESILVAFILAFIFRAFVVEAFVIPTGSMAPTLYGAHMRLTCPDCGYTFDAGYRGTKNGDDIDIPSDLSQRPDRLRCPNCGYDFPTTDALAHPIPESVRFGDRILVLKYLYIFQKPRRWDVVVFKSPDEQKSHVAEDPEYGQNYIKRLIGTPTESIVILDGDIYVGPRDANGVDADGHVVDNVGKLFQIQRKPDFVQDRLWRLVFDNDFIPQGHVSSRALPWHQPWQVSDGTGWDVSRRVFEFNNAGGSGNLFFNPNANRDVTSGHNLNTFPLTDWISYDQLEDGNKPTEPRQQYDDTRRDRSWVSDLKLSCFYTRKSGDGPLRLYLTKSDHCFVAEITPGKVSLYESKVVSPSDESSGHGFDPGTLTLVKSESIPELTGSTPVQIDFMNYDYQVLLRVNGKEVCATPYQYAPDVKGLWQRALNRVDDPMARPEVRISAEHQNCSLEHIALSHDIYYGNRSPGGNPFWASPGEVMHLNEGEYFVLGDNSQISGDARYWRDPIQLPHEGLPDTEGGRVPESFMLGKAFFVYWPAGYRMPYVPARIIPDFGEMRFIH